MSNGKVMTILLTVGLKKRYYKMSQYFPSYEVFKSYNIKVVLDLSGYVKKTESYLAYFWGKTYFNSNFLVFTVKEEYFTLSNGDNIEDWKSIGLSNKYLNVKGTVGDVILSKPIKPMHLIFSGKGSLVQKQIDAI